MCATGAVPADTGVVQTRYAHLTKTCVKSGDKVEAGQLIGYTGGEPGYPNSGESSGPHLHFETRIVNAGNGVRNVDTTPIEPLEGLRRLGLNVSEYGRIMTSGFSSSRAHPVSRKVRPHYGVDFGVPVGTPVYAPAAGTVVWADLAGGLGLAIYINHCR